MSGPKALSALTNTFSRLIADQFFRRNINKIEQYEELSVLFNGTEQNRYRYVGKSQSSQHL